MLRSDLLSGKYGHLKKKFKCDATNVFLFFFLKKRFLFSTLVV